MAMSAYLYELRRKVGNDLLLLPAVSVFVVDEATGRVLLCRNAGQTHWEAIGGMVEPNEHPLTAAQRELEEETGLLVQAKDLVLLGVVGGPEYLVTYPNGHQVSYVTSVYRVSRPAAQHGSETPPVSWQDSNGGFKEGEEAGLKAVPGWFVEPVADGLEITAVGWHHRADDLAQPDPARYGLFVRSLLAEFVAKL
jgi:8-oxo-dGTP pyrophosphatase MutT (NUDIX family)